MLASVIYFNLFYIFSLELNIYIYPNIRQAELVVVQSPSRVQLFVTPRTAVCQASLSSPSPRVCPSSCPMNWWCHSTILLSPSFLLSLIFLSIRVFPNESVVHIRWLKHWRYSIGPSKQYSELISFRIGWFDLLAVQETLKSLLQHHSSKALILWQSSFFIVQLSHSYVTTGKTIVLTEQTCVGKVMPLHFNILYRFVIHSFLAKKWSSSNFTAEVIICSDFRAQ